MKLSHNVCMYLTCPERVKTPVSQPASSMELTKLLSVELLELIGRHINALPTVNAFHRVVALRNNIERRTPAQVRKFASIMTMIGQNIIEGNLYLLPMVPLDYNATFNSHRSNALLFHAINKTAGMTLVDRMLLLQSIVSRFPQVMMLRDGETHTPLHTAVLARNTLFEITPFLEEYTELMNVDRLLFADILKDTPLHVAIAYQVPYETLEKLIDVEQKILTMQNSDGFTPLHALFCHCGNFLAAAYVRLLSFPDSPVDNNALLLLVDKEGNMPLHMALKIEIESDGDTVHNLMSIDFAEIVKLLVDTNQDVLEHKNRSIVHPEDESSHDAIATNTPLHLAVQRRMSWTVLQLLIDQHEHVLPLRNSVDQRGNAQFATALHIAIELALPEDAISGLIDHGARVLLVRNYFSDMPLHTSLRKKTRFNLASQEESCKNLIRRGVEAHADFLLIIGHGGDTALHVAAKHDTAISIIRMLVNADDRPLLIFNSFGEDDDDTPENREVDTPLHSALKARADYQVLSLLVDVDETVLFMVNAAEETPLHIAARQNMSPEVVAFLIPGRAAHRPDAPLDVLLARDNDGNTPLHLALLADADFRVIQLLLDEDKLVLNTSNNAMQIPLHIAAGANASLETIMMLIMQTVPGDVDMRLKVDNTRSTALHMALCRNVCIEIVQLLIDPDGKVLEILNNELETPLHNAVSNKEKNSFYIVEELLRAPLGQRGDVRTLQDIRGNTACHIACSYPLLCTPSFMLLDMLIDPAKVVLNTRNNKLQLPLHLGIWMGLKRVQLLLAVTAHTTKWPLRFMPDSEGNTPLHTALNSMYALDTTNIAVVQLLIDDEELVLGALNEKEMTPLHVAMSNFPWETMTIPACRKMLCVLLGERPFKAGGFPLPAIRQHIRLQMVDSFHETLLQNAMEAHVPYELLPMLIDKQQNVLSIKKEYWNDEQQSQIVFYELPLNALLCARRPRSAAGKLRWEQQKFPCTPWATIVTFLIDSRKNVLWQLDRSRHLPLHNAILHELKIEIIQELLPPVVTNDKHPDFERRVLLGAPGYTPLQVAVRRRADIAVYRLLLAHFHDPGYHTLTCRADNDETALMTAVRMGCSTEITRLFIDRDENVLFLSNLLQLTPLHVALETGLSTGHVQMMMDKHKKVLKCRCNKRNTPLHTALLNRDIDVAVLDLLLAGNADSAENIQQCLKMKDAQGRTPLDLAVQQFSNWDARGLAHEWCRIILQLEESK